MELLTQTLGQISPTANPRLAKQIQDRLDSLTKPRGSLGRLEEIVLQYGLARGQSRLPPPRKSLFVFCADHGVTAEGVSAYPREVTYQMVRNFVSGGAAINVLCRQLGIDPVIVDMGWVWITIWLRFQVLCAEKWLPGREISCANQR